MLVIKFNHKTNKEKPILDNGLLMTKKPLRYWETIIYEVVIM